MKECIEEWWRIGRKIQPQMRNTQISPSFPTWFPRDPKVLQALQASKKCPRSAPSRVFPASSENAPLSLFICWEKGQNAQLRVVLASRSPVGEPLARLQRRHAAGLPVGFVKMHWLASGSPVGMPLACSFRWLATCSPVGEPLASLTLSKIRRDF